MNKQILLSGIILVFIGIEVLSLIWNDVGILTPYLAITTIMFALGIGIAIRGSSMKPEFKYGKFILGRTLAIFIYLGADMFFHYPYRVIIQFGTFAIII